MGKERERKRWKFRYARVAQYTFCANDSKVYFVSPTTFPQAQPKPALVTSKAQSKFFLINGDFIRSSMSTPNKLKITREITIATIIFTNPPLFLFIFF